LTSARVRLARSMPASKRRDRRFRDVKAPGIALRRAQGERHM
jgi:hypothetical protein